MGLILETHLSLDEKYYFLMKNPETILSFRWAREYRGYRRKKPGLHPVPTVYAAAEFKISSENMIFHML